MNVNNHWATYNANRTEANRANLFMGCYEYARLLSRLIRKKYPTYSVDELVSFTYERIQKCINEYDPDRGCGFTSYLSSRLQGGMLDGIRCEARKRNSENKKTCMHPCVTCSLDEPRMPDGNQIPHPIDPNADVSERMERAEFWESIANLIADAGEVSQKILLGYYRDGLTMQEISQKVNLSESRISQLHKKFMPLLRSKTKVAENGELVVCG